MKRVLLLSALGLTLFSSCSTTFKAGQTPDDVYYSPGREIAAAREDKVREKDQAVYEEYVSSQDDRYLRMKVANRNRWSSLDDYTYWYDSRYDFCNLNNYTYYNPWVNNWSLGIGYGSRSYYYGNYGWNNPFYTVVYYSTPKTSFGGYTSGSNISAYRNKVYNNSNYGYRDPKTGAFTSTSNSNNFGNLIKRVFTSGSNSSGTSTSYDRPARTFNTTTPGTNSSNSTPSTSSSAGGHSGGYSSTGSSTSTGRGGRG